MASFRVPGVPVPKARPRVTYHGGKAKAYTPHRTRDYERLVAMSYDGPLYKGKVAVDLTFYLPDRRRVDIDNLIKAVLDGLNHRAYPDDGHVFEVTARKAESAEFPCVVGEVREV